RPLLASLGDTVNNLTIATDGPRGSPFERRFAIVVTANRTTAARVRAALVASGLPERAINVMPIPTPLARVGLERPGDRFQLLHRVALFDDRAAGEAYLASPGTRVFRVSPRQRVAPRAFATPALRRHGTGTTEAALRGSLDALGAAILERHGRARAEQISVAHRTPFQVHQFGYWCIARGVSCLADNHDTLYPYSEPFRLRPRDRVIVWGVNHEAAGKATYANFTVYGIRHLVGVVSVDSRQLAGSAADYVPNDPNVSRLYAWTVARACGDAPHCTEIPTGCPGVDLDRRGYVAFRMYMEPATATSPHPDELLLDRVTRFPAPE
ncbi:MAG: hypothetical protein IT379_20000, partial [Deltaproteobacteria bacterium]|nr:hypothetical protein [Deltaproteobacteria bacterium]